MVVALEDNPADIIGKAMRGLGLGTADLAARSGVAARAIDSFLGGAASPIDLPRLAVALGLDPTALAALAAGRHQPHPGNLPDGFAAATAPFGGMSVNSFLVWNPLNRHAVLFDTGAAGPLLALVQQAELTLTAVFLTHAHPDHCAGLTEITSRFRIPVHASAAEAAGVPGSQPFDPGARFQIDHVTLITHDTRGHSPGHTAFTVHGLSRPVAIAGDAIFAGSMGGPRGDYAEQLGLTRGFLHHLDPVTLIAPGHGPLTTAHAERTGNPFLSDALTDS